MQAPESHARLSVIGGGTCDWRSIALATRQVTVAPARAKVTPFARAPGAQTIQAERVQRSAWAQPEPPQTFPVSAQSETTEEDAEVAQHDANLASELTASGATTQPVETVIAVLAARRAGSSINAAAKASGINYRTAQRIVQAATERLQLMVVS
jgi:hypothetical protein